MKTQWITAAVLDLKAKGLKPPDHQIQIIPNAFSCYNITDISICILLGAYLTMLSVAQTIQHCMLG
jgi:hypothetical protein